MVYATAMWRSSSRLIKVLQELLAAKRTIEIGGADGGGMVGLRRRKRRRDECRAQKKKGRAGFDEHRTAGKRS